MIQFLPKNLDLQKLLSENPPDFKFHIDHFIHICNLLTELSSKRKDTMREGGWIPLHAHSLKRVNNSYPKYISYLIKHGVMECDNSYIVGEKSKCYRFAPKYHDRIQPVHITKYTLTKNLKQVQRCNRWALAKYDYLYKWFNDGLTVDFNRAEKKLEEIYQQDLDKGEVNALHKFNANFINLIKLQKKEHVFTIDNTSFRLHTLLSRLKRELRPCLTYNDVQLANIDIQCAQPTLSLSLFEPSFYNTDPKQERVSIYNIDPKLAELLPMKTIADYVNENQSKFDTYRELVFNDLYLGMGAIIKQHGINIPTDRNSMKSMMLTIMYSSNKFLGGNQGIPKRVFKKCFPEIYTIFKMFKLCGNEKLPILLQKIESKLILDKIAKTISKAEPSMPLYTIHDSVVVDAKKVNLCKEIIKQESIKFLGYEPKLKVDLWGLPTERSIS